jgi:hypothetical protein
VRLLSDVCVCDGSQVGNALHKKSRLQHLYIRQWIDKIAISHRHTILETSLRAIPDSAGRQIFAVHKNNY